MVNTKSAILFLYCWISVCPEIIAQRNQCGLTRQNGDLFPPTDFAFEMYHKTMNVADGNIFFSPVSISLAIGMLYQGAKGVTASEIDDAFFPALKSGQSVPAYANLMRSINRKNKPYALDTANAIYTPNSGSVLDSKFQNTVKQCFRSEVELKPFRSQPEICRKDINKWVEGKTRNLIKDFLPRGSIDASTEIVIVNAIYFKGQWLEKFEKRETQKKNFQGLTGNSQVDMMHAYGKEFPFYENKQEGFKVLELPYKGEELSMIIFLPDKSRDFKSFEADLSGTKMRNAMNQMYPRDIDTVAIPKFKIEYELPLERVMKSMGVNSMFDASSADLSGITGQKGLYVSGAIHKAVIEVNEQGSEAAAATGILMAGSAFNPIPDPDFIADSPFMYLIVYKEAELILFMGKYQ